MKWTIVKQARPASHEKTRVEDLLFMASPAVVIDLSSALILCVYEKIIQPSKAASFVP